MEIWMIWLIAAAVLIVIEIMTQMMWALCLAAGTLAAMVCAISGAGFGWQVAAMVAMCAVAYVVLLPLFKRWHARRDNEQARTGMDALLGRRATVTHEIRPGELGRARIDGDNWQVKAPGATETIHIGKEVVVTAYDSIILTVSEIRNL